MTDDIPEVEEIVPGDYAVRIGGRQVRVLVPAGVGVPGVDEAELAGAVIAVLEERGSRIDDVVDISALLRRDPQLLTAVSRRVDPDT